MAERSHPESLKSSQKTIQLRGIIQFRTSLYFSNLQQKYCEHPLVEGKFLLIKNKDKPIQ